MEKPALRRSRTIWDDRQKRVRLETAEDRDVMEEIARRAAERYEDRGTKALAAGILGFTLGPLASILAICFGMCSRTSSGRVGYRLGVIGVVAWGILGAVLAVVYLAKV